MLFRATGLSLATLAALLVGPAAGTATAKTAPPKLIELRCVPKSKPGCAPTPTVAVGAQVQLRGQRLKAGMRVSFRWSKGALAARLSKTKVGWVTRVPAGTATGTIRVTVTDAAGRRSNQRGVNVVAEAPQTRPAAQPSGPAEAAFAGDGMWIWYLKQSNDGDLDQIAARAKAAGMTTVFVKSADGATPWTQLSRAVVDGLHDRGLKVCGWQFVYGDNPAGEARAAMSAVNAGADCFVIDAETRYEGRYAAAQTYMTALRTAAGPSYPIGLTSFPYVDFHPRLPYSVFLGPGGAQVNLPQVYWADIGASVDAVSAKTVANNRIYKVPIAPIGQTYGTFPAADLRRFRAIWAGYGAPGLSWWSWQATSQGRWDVLTERAPTTVRLPDPGWPSLAKGDTGDQVIWLQMHLAAVDRQLAIDGRFTAATDAALKAFQTSKGLPATGETDALTWQTVLELTPVAGDWN
ncbi:MAG: peptidoglycan-binding protein [Solirubrobacteraceae bacterium]|nr:peptidoglycan-binding protein [Solirubrobacteraceae bacterium]